MNPLESQAVFWQIATNPEASVGWRNKAVVLGGARFVRPV
jgi:hypothetical protein